MPEDGADRGKRCDACGSRANSGEDFCPQCGIRLQSDGWTLEVTGREASEVANVANAVTAGLSTKQEKTVPINMAGASESKVAILLSHSHRDGELAGALVEFFRMSLQLPATAIRATSVDGSRLSSAGRVDDQLVRDIHDSQIVIGLITPRSVRSAYVQAELGGRWAAKRPLFLLLGRTKHAELLRDPLKGFPALACDQAAQLHQLVTDLARSLSITPQPAAAYQVQLDRIISVSLRPWARWELTGYGLAVGSILAAFGYLPEREFHTDIVVAGVASIAGGAFAGFFAPALSTVRRLLIVGGAAGASWGFVNQIVLRTSAPDVSFAWSAMIVVGGAVAGAIVALLVTLVHRFIVTIGD